MTLGVTRGGNHQQIIFQLNRLESSRLQLDRRRSRVDVVAMQDSLRAEALVELGVIGNVVLMREQQTPHAAQHLDVLHQWRRESRRVDQDLLIANVVADRAKGRLRSVAAAVNVLRDQLRQSGHGSLHVTFRQIADRGRRT